MPGAVIGQGLPQSLDHWNSFLLVKVFVVLYSQVVIHHHRLLHHVSVRQMVKCMVGGDCYLLSKNGPASWVNAPHCPNLRKGFEGYQ
jgi:hypothetical protein